MSQSANKKSASATAWQLLMVALATAVSVIVGFGLFEAIVAALSYAGYVLAENWTPWLRIIVPAMCVAWGQRFVMRRLGIKL